MIIRSTFLAGRMNKDASERVLKPGEYRHAENIRIVNSEGSDVGVIEKSLSNKQLTNLNLGTNPKTIGSLEDEFEEKIYWLVKSDSGCYLIEHDTTTQLTEIVLEDTRAGAANALAFDESKKAQMVLIIDSDNDNRLLLFTDYNTQPKCVNIERAKTFTASAFSEESILLIKKPPLDAPTITMGDTTDNVENYIEEKFLSFGYRYEYEDGEFSAISPFSEMAFMPKPFNYNYSTGDNESMVNNYSKVTIGFNTGGPLVKGIDLVFKESGANSIYVIESFNKAEKSWADNTTQTFDFVNKKSPRVLPEKELYRLYDNVPLKAKAIALIKNRVVFGNYVENYDLVDALDSKVVPNFDISLDTQDIVTGTPTKSAKSNRDYEVCLGYVDDFGRMTTPLPSENNTVYIPNGNSIKQNRLKATVKHKAPSFAKKFRFFVKQSKTDYEAIIPTLFYEDGVYRWVKMENSDKDKVKEGDFLVVKIDSQGSTSARKTVKVLEVATKEANFISNVLVDPVNEGSDITEEAGLYFKVKPDGFRLNRADFTLYEFEAYEATFDTAANSLRSLAAIVEDPIYYGTVGLNDISANGPFTGNADIRYRIEIDSVGGTDTFRWSKDDGQTWVASSVAITAGVAQTLDNGVQITFTAGTGHDISDYWIVSAKEQMTDDDSKAWGFFKSVDEEIIRGGARISLVYDEKGQETEFVEKSFVASQNYANLEEWFYGDSIIDQLSPLTIGRIWFRRGTIGKHGNDNKFSYFNQDAAGVMVMIVRSAGTRNNFLDGDARVNTSLEVFQNEQNVIFETQPKDTGLNIFFEIGKTYDIDANGYHTGGDTDQSSGVDGVFTLPYFNCFSWGNGFESYKIRDAYNARTMKIDTRPSTPIENYRQNKRIAYLNYSNVYEQSTQYNAINEFNLGLVNFFSVDDKFGSIQRIVPLNTNLDVYQEDRVNQILYQKSSIYTANGTQQIVKSDSVMEITDLYTGEYGISKDPESLAVFGNYTYWTDKKRGLVLRKGRSGIEVISNFGMKDWFRDHLPGATTIIGGIDPYTKQYVLRIDNYTLSFSEQLLMGEVILKGWTSFWSYLPDAMARLNSRFFTIKNGQLYAHNDTADGYNKFYGVQYTAKVTPVFGQNSEFDKVFKTLVLESKLPWDAAVKTNLTETTIAKPEFIQSKSKWYAFLRRNEDDTNLTGTANGIGVIDTINGTLITMKSAVNPMVSIGDVLYQYDGSNQEVIGTIQKIEGKKVTVDSIVTTPVVGYFAFSKKDSRIEGSEIEGYYMEVELTDESNDENTIFAVGSNVVKSVS